MFGFLIMSRFSVSGSWSELSFEFRRLLWGRVRWIEQIGACAFLFVFSIQLAGGISANMAGAPGEVFCRSSSCGSLWCWQLFVGTIPFLDGRHFLQSGDFSGSAILRAWSQGFIPQERNCGCYEGPRPCRLLAVVSSFISCDALQYKRNLLIVIDFIEIVSKPSTCVPGIPPLTFFVFFLMIGVSFNYKQSFRVKTRGGD